MNQVRFNNVLKHYTFIRYKKRPTKLIAVIIIALIITLALFTITLYNYGKVSEIFMGLAIIFIFFGYRIITLFYKFYAQQALIVNKYGIEFIKCRGLDVPKEIRWGDLAKIYYVISNNTPLFNALGNQLLFVLNDGKSYCLSIQTNKQELYINQTAPQSLLETIKFFFENPIEQISAQHKEYIKTNEAFIDLGKEVGHVAYTSAFIVIITILLSFTLSTVLLDNSNQLWWYVLAATLAVLLSVWHMRRVKFYIMIIPCLLIAVTSAFLMLPVTSALPKLIGTPTKLTFTISAENEEQQTWQSINNSSLYFERYISPRLRIYHQAQQPQVELTIYQTSIGLDAIDRDEYRKLFH